MLVAGKGPAVPRLPRREILSAGDASLQASHETGQWHDQYPSTSHPRQMTSTTFFVLARFFLFISLAYTSYLPYSSFWFIVVFRILSSVSVDFSLFTSYSSIIKKRRFLWFYLYIFRPSHFSFVGYPRAYVNSFNAKVIELFVCFVLSVFIWWLHSMFCFLSRLSFASEYVQTCF